MAKLGFNLGYEVDGDMKEIVEMEERICVSLVTELLAQGFFISVFDGEEMALSKSNDPVKILHAMCSTDEDTLYVYRDNGTGMEQYQCIGKFFLVYGNDGWDVIADQSAAISQIAPTPKTDRLIDELEKTEGEAQLARDLTEC